MKSYILTIAMLLIYSLSYGQKGEYTICGYVKDSLTREPLIGVTVMTENNRGAVTNTYGFYSFSSVDKDMKLSFSHIGYTMQHKAFKLQADTTLDILLYRSVLKLNDVVVTSNTPTLARTKSNGAITINSEQLKYIPSFLGEQDIFKYFQLLPGVVAGKEGSSGINIRGGSSDQTLIMMDDIPIYNHSHAFGFVSIFSGEFIKSAELYKGYIPPNYGGRLSGVATMNMREGNRNEHKQMLQIGMLTASALAEGPINRGKGSYLVGGRYFVPDLFLKAYSAASSNMGVIPIVGFYDITAKASYDLGDKNSIYLNFYSGRDAINIGYNYLEEDAITNMKFKTKSSSGLNWGNIAGSIRLSSQLNSRLFMNTTAYYSLLANEKHSEYKDFTGNKNTTSNTRSRMSEFGIKTQFEQSVKSWYNLSYGLNIAYQYFTPLNLIYNNNGLISNIEYRNKKMYCGTIFLDNKFTFNRFEINAGGRMSIFNNIKESVISFEPRLSMSYKMPHSSLSISYVQNVQPLFPMNQSYYSLPIDYWIPFQNADELPRSEQLAIGYKYSFDSGLEIFGEAYIKDSKNISLIHNKDDYLLEEGGYNLATGRAYGAEIMVQYKKKRFNFMGSYTYSSSHHYFGGQKVNFMYDTPHNLNLFGSYETVRRENKRHTLSVNVNYKTGIPYVITNEIYPTNEKYNNSWLFGGNASDVINNPLFANKRLDNFFRVDINYSMEKMLKKGSRVWQISILNVSAHKNPYIIYHNTLDGDSGYKALRLIPFLPSFSYKRMF